MKSKRYNPEFVLHSCGEDKEVQQLLGAVRGVPFPRGTVGPRQAGEGAARQKHEVRWQLGIGLKEIYINKKKGPPWIRACYQCTLMGLPGVFGKGDIS